MRQLRAWLLRFKGLFRNDAREREFADELESHLQMHIEDNIRAGMSPQEAKRVAKAELIVAGSHGRSALGRLFLGSISQWLLNEARCSVRVARGKLDEPDFPVRLIVGIDGSNNANLALEQVESRNWPEKSEVRVIVVDQPLEPTLVGELVPAVRHAVEEFNEEETRHSRVLAAQAARRLSEKGLRVEGVVKIGDPKRVLVQFAKEWRADCIFLGATGLSNRFERFLLGSTAGAVAARAHCSVEIVRTRKHSGRSNNNGNGKQ